MKKVMLAVLAIMLMAAVAVTAADAPIALLGLGHVISIKSSKDATATATAVGQVDTVMAAVAFDVTGKIVKVSIDNAQTKVNFDKDMKVSSDVTVAPMTKVELKEGYGMGKVSTIKLEWYQQMANFEKSANMYEAFVATYDLAAGDKAVGYANVKDLLKKEAEQRAKDAKAEK